MKKQREAFKKRMNILKGLLAAIAVFFIVGSVASANNVKHDTIWAAGSGVVIATGVALTDAEKAIADKLKEELVQKFDDLLLGNTGMKELKAFMEKFNQAKTPEDVEKLKTGLNELGLRLKEMEEEYKSKFGKSDEKPASFADNIMSGVKALWSKPENIQHLKNNRSASLGVKLMYEQAARKAQGLKDGQKAAITMTEGAAVVPIGTNSIPFSLTEFEPGLTRRARRQPFITQLVNMSRTIMEFVAWAEQTSIDPGVAGNTAEGAAKTQGSFTITEKNTRVEKMTYFIKISKEMLDDLSFIENEIRTELMDVLALRLDSQVLKGNGTSPQLKGILQYAQAFNPATPLAGQVSNVSNYDCLVAAILQVRALGNTVNGEVYDIFEPTDVVLHPADATIMGLTKDSLGRYLMPPFMTPDGKRIENLPITENVGMTQGSFLVGDMMKSNLRMREDANISIGYENDDFTKNLVTILGEVRGAHYIKENHKNAFVSDTFTNVKGVIGSV